MNRDQASRRRSVRKPAARGEPIIIRAIRREESFADRAEASKQEIVPMTKRHIIKPGCP
jgi:hypothetical protein